MTSISVPDYCDLYLRNIWQAETNAANLWASRVNGLLEGFQVLEYITIKQYKEANKIVDSVRAGRISVDESKKRMEKLFNADTENNAAVVQ